MRSCRWDASNFKIPSQENISSLTSFPRARIPFLLPTLISYYVTTDSMRINLSKHRTASQSLTRSWLKPKKGAGGTIGMIGKIRLLWLVSHKINLPGIVCTWCYREFVLYAKTITHHLKWIWVIFCPSKYDMLCLDLKKTIFPP